MALTRSRQMCAFSGRRVVSIIIAHMIQDERGENVASGKIEGGHTNQSSHVQ